MSSTRRPLAALLVLGLCAACGASPDEVARNLSSPNPVVKEDSAKIADNFDSPEVRAALVVALQDPSERTRLNAIESLVEMGKEIITIEEVSLKIETTTISVIKDVPSKEIVHKTEAEEEILITLRSLAKTFLNMCGT